MSKILIVGDMHLTDAEADSYRWDTFTWIRGLVREHYPQAVVFLGDMLHKKDRHPNRLLQRVADELRDVASVGSETRPVILLRGNHDGVDPQYPALRWLDGGIPGDLLYLHEPKRLGFPGALLLGIPHGQWPDPKDDLSEVDLVLLHHTVDGASSGGYTLHGVPAKQFRQLYKQGLRKDVQILAGDIHEPQTVDVKWKGGCAAVEYVGAPHPVVFGDTWCGRVALWDSEDGSIEWLMREGGIVRAKIEAYPTDQPSWVDALGTTADDVPLEKGDQVKLTLILPRDSVHEWPRYKQEALDFYARIGVRVFGVKLQERERTAAKKKIDVAPGRTPAQLVEEYAKAKKLDKVTKTEGKRIVEEVSK